SNQGIRAIAIGQNAGQTAQNANSICLNASGIGFAVTSVGFWVNPVRTAAGGGGVPLLSLLGNEIVRNTDKTFVIEHPIDKNKYLVHACLEGPESGVYYRGDSIINYKKNKTILLPDYVQYLASNFTVHVTP